MCFHQLHYTNRCGVCCREIIQQSHRQGETLESLMGKITRREKRREREGWTEYKAIRASSRTSGRLATYPFVAVTSRASRIFPYLLFACTFPCFYAGLNIAFKCIMGIKFCEIFFKFGGKLIWLTNKTMLLINMSFIYNKIIL